LRIFCILAYNSKPTHLLMLISLQEINQPGATTAKKMKLTLQKGLKKFSSKAHLEPSEPTSLTAADR